MITTNEPQPISIAPYRSAEVEKLATALSKAQGEFATVKKSKTAKIPGKEGRAGYEYSYADLEDIREAVTPALSKHELAVIQGLDAERNILTTTLVHSSGQFWAATFQLAKGLTPQQFGSQLTYARRYSFTSLVFVFGDDTYDDDGARAEEGVARQEKKKKTAPALIPANTQPPQENMRQALAPVPHGQTREGIMGKMTGAYTAYSKLVPEFDVAAAMYERYGATNRQELKTEEAWDLLQWLERELKKGMKV